MAQPTVLLVDRTRLGSRRRRAAVFIVLASAALATAGTSASPPPLPLATAQTSGALEVTTDLPIASVVVTLEANEAAHAVAGSRLGATVTAGGKAGADGPTIAIIEPLDVSDSHPAFGSTASLTGSLDASCVAPQTCSGRYRITAILVDPTVKQATVAWQASTELHVDRPDRPSTAPEGAHLAAAGGDVSTRPARELARAALTTESVHLGADRPLASRFIELDQPAGPAMASADRTWLAFLTITDPAGLTESRQSLIQLVMPGLPGALASRTVGRVPFFPPACEGDRGCTTPLRLDLGAPSGTQEVERDVSWSIAVLSFGPAGTDPDHVGVRLTDSWDVRPETARLEQATTGSFDISKSANGVHVAAVTLDASRVAQASGPMTGFVQLRYEVRAAPTPGGAKINVGVDQPDRQSSGPSAYGQIQPGAALTLLTQVVTLDCTGRTRCSVAAPFFANTSEAGPSVHLDWTVTATWFPDRGAPIADGLALTLETSAPSAAP